MVIFKPVSKSFWRIGWLLSTALVMSACTTIGPGRSTIEKAPQDSVLQGIHLVDLDETNLLSIQANHVQPGFADIFGLGLPDGSLIGNGDILEVTIWEAPPAVLFGAAVSEKGSSGQGGRPTTLPAFVVTNDGTIEVPFAGTISVAGKTLGDIERAIQARLRGKAHQPQVIARTVRNATSTVTVVGDAGRSARIPLSPKGETILDILAEAGGTGQSAEKITIQITRNGRTHRMPLKHIIERPADNIILQSNDLVTAIYQPFSFTALGASGRNEEIKFEATGLTLAEAIGRIGGLQDFRANPKGVFLFRWEKPEALNISGVDSPVKLADGRVPVIYNVNMKEPATYFLMQRFRMEDEDVLFVANSSASEIQRFAGIVASTILPIVSLENSLSRN